jgi:hypothetical protein
MRHAEIESSPDAKARSVSFSSIEVREYPLCIGDNPGCRRGVSSCVR